MTVKMVWNGKHKGKRGWLVIGRIGGSDTFWEGYEYSVGVFRWYWLAFVRGWLHITNKPFRAVRFEYEATSVGRGSDKV